MVLQNFIFAYVSEAENLGGQGGLLFNKGGLSPPKILFSHKYQRQRTWGGGGRGAYFLIRGG